MHKIEKVICGLITDWGLIAVRPHSAACIDMFCRRWQVDSRSILCSLYRFFQSSGCVTWAILSSHALLRIPVQSMSIVSRSSGTKMLPLKLCAASRAYSVLRVASVLSSVWYSSRFFTPSSAATAPASMAVL